MPDPTDAWARLRRLLGWCHDWAYRRFMRAGKRRNRYGIY